MKSTQLQKLLYFDVFITSLFVLGCFLAAMVTNQMVRGRVTHPDVEAINYGEIQFGLIWGTKQYNYGYGLRDEQTYFVYDEYDGVHHTSLIITTLCLVGVASVSMILSIVFALMNTMTVPKHEIQGIPGLFVWNGTAAGFSLAATIFYTSLFEAQIKNNIKSSDEEGFEEDDAVKTRVGYSFWLLFSGMMLVMTNLVVIYLAKKNLDDPAFFRRKKEDPILDDTVTQKKIGDAMLM